MKLLWLHLPGLCATTFDDSQWERLAPTHHTRLVPSFPWWRGCVHASMRFGTTPLEHGVLWHSDGATPGAIDVLDRGPDATRALETSFDHLHDFIHDFPALPSVDLWCVRVREPLGDFTSEELAERLRSLVAAVDRLDARMLWTGDLARDPSHWQLAPDQLPQAAGIRLQHAEGRVAWFELDGGHELGEWRDATLAVNGVDRVLLGRGLELFGAPASRQAAVLLGPGGAFRADAPPLENPPILVEKPSPPLLCGWGDAQVPAWTDAAHDYRVAATVVAALEDPPRADLLRGPASALRF